MLYNTMSTEHCCSESSRQQIQSDVPRLDDPHTGEQSALRRLYAGDGNLRDK